MGILGLTHDENGSALEKLPVTIKVAIGEGPAPDDENSSPRALLHFVFKRRTMRGQMVCWEPAPDIAEVSVPPSIGRGSQSPRIDTISPLTPECARRRNAAGPLPSLTNGLFQPH